MKAGSLKIGTVGFIRCARRRTFLTGAPGSGKDIAEGKRPSQGGIRRKPDVGTG